MGRDAKARKYREHSSFHISLIVAATLTASILLIYLQTIGFDYINYDDDVYIPLNPKVRSGLTMEGIVYAFTAIDERTHWHPLTWLSYMLDCEIFGVKPGPQHAVNVLLFGLLCWVLFRFWSEATGHVERSATAVLLFAVHPLRVESVAWIAERKDMLSGLFVALTLLVYRRYAAAPSTNLYLWTLAWFVLALLSKPAAVTVPVLLLLLDYWPLRRPFTLRLLYEKVPFAMLSIATALVTLLGASKLGAMEMIVVPLLTRLQKAPEFLWTYVVLTFWPVNLANLYPYDLNTSQWLVFIVLIATLTAAVFLVRRRHPYLLFGWMWFVVAVAPNLGIVQSGVQSTADRFTFFGHIGLITALVWTTAEYLKGYAAKAILPALLVVLAGISYARTSVWKDSISIFESAVRTTPLNWMARLKLGTAYEERRDFAQAEPNLREAAKIRPDDFHAPYNLGKVLAATNRPAEAAEWFARAVANKSDYAEAYYSFGVMKASTAHYHEARTSLEKSVALNIEPAYRAEAFNLIGTTYGLEGRFNEALQSFERSLKVNRMLVAAQINKAKALVALNRQEEALQYLKDLQKFNSNAEVRALVEQLQKR